MSFIFKKLKIPDVIIIEPIVFNDARGFFMETYKKSEFFKANIKKIFLQDNQSFSASTGTLRGLHYQLQPYAQDKLIRVVKGSIFDVAVDLRKNSPTYGKWVGVIISAKNKKQLYIPEGFAHGFVTLESNTEVIYKSSKEYAPKYERGIIWNDKTLKIKWPIPNPILNQKDKNFPTFLEAEKNFI